MFFSARVMSKRGFLTESNVEEKSINKKNWFFVPPLLFQLVEVLLLRRNRFVVVSMPLTNPICSGLM